MNKQKACLCLGIKKLDKNKALCDKCVIRDWNREILDEDISVKLIRLSKKYPQMCQEYLDEMHNIINWAEKELKKLNETFQKNIKNSESIKTDRW